VGGSSREKLARNFETLQRTVQFFVAYLQTS